MSKFDINAYNKLNDAFNYVQELKTSRTANGGDTGRVNVDMKFHVNSLVDQ